MTTLHCNGPTLHSRPCTLERREVKREGGGMERAVKRIYGSANDVAPISTTHLLCHKYFALVTDISIDTIRKKVSSGSPGVALTNHVSASFGQTQSKIL